MQERLRAVILVWGAMTGGCVGAGSDSEVLTVTTDRHSASTFDPNSPPTDCTTYVAFDRYQTMSGYLIANSAGEQTCIPFTTSRYLKPKGYEGDYYVDEFTDAKLRQRWLACKQAEGCSDRVLAQLLARRPPNKEYGLTDESRRYLLGKIPEDGANTDLTVIRRPGFFANGRYSESVADADSDTAIVEFALPVEPYERIHRGMTGMVHVRGWYIRGHGVDLGEGRRERALVIHSGGGGDRVTAIDDPAGDGRGALVRNNRPDGSRGTRGQRHWREVWRKFHDAGFDVLAFDRRGVGISGGFSDTNTLQQGRDLLAIVESLRTGQGLRALLPDGTMATGRTAAVAMNDGAPKGGLPVFLMGTSRGTIASSWAMAMNFDRACTFDQPEIACSPGKQNPNIRGAILIAAFSSGVGYLPAETTELEDARGTGKDRGLFIGGSELEHNIVFFPSSAILAGISKWPSVYFARGLWDFTESLEGTVDAYSRVDGPKELVVVRGAHDFRTWPKAERQRATDRAIAYSKTVLRGEDRVIGGTQWSNLKELVATSREFQEPNAGP